MEEDKTSFGIRIRDSLGKELDKIVEESKYLDVSRSEVVEAILIAFFRSDVDHGERVRELVIKKRKDKL
ncbi:transposase [candidate division MSBL1 archaeon SCGC-AAA382A03]|uniref:Transposase n=1 Tax=candidate division MSBL1 archaeon SCGC-AAA382A03 TaxID=1698278 RepID=A0A133VCL0_9EURY|nr:transposase [candidate division MSBL1 archaeon SCGC-AAA382A03]